MTETCFTGKSCLLSYRGLEVLHPIYKPTASRCSFCNYLVSARCYIASIKSYRKHCLFHSFSHNHTRTLFYSSSTSVPLLLSHLHSIHIPHSHTHSIHNTIQFNPFPSQAHTTLHLFPPSPSTPISNSPHQPHWDPNTREK